MSEIAGIAGAGAEGGRVLALRVLEQAILDATSAPILRGRTRSQCRPVEDEQREAVRFLTKPAGEWAASRRAWCDLAEEVTFEAERGQPRQHRQNARAVVRVGRTQIEIEQRAVLVADHE